METKAAVATKAGAPLTIETVQLDGPRAFEVLVEIKASGVCHTDMFTLSGDDPEGIFPAILGHEGAGVVVEVGPGVTTLKPGDVISTGTPPGVGLGQKPEPVYLNAGDVMELGIEGLGEQRQVVAQA